MAHNVIIIGSGPAGLTAAIYTARANLSPLMFEGYQAGGQLMLTTEVENFPGFENGITGPELIDEMRKQALRFAADIQTKDVTRVDFSARPFKVWVGDDMYEAESVIISTGASAKLIGLESEEKLLSKGVSTCATCDGAFFREKEIAVIGGGDSAMEEANFLTRFASKVTLIHRREELRASKIMQDRARANEKIEWKLNYVPTEITAGDNGLVNGIQLKNTKTEAEEHIALSGVFIAIGHNPNTELFKGQIELDAQGYILTEPGTPKTNVEGVFAAGDVQDTVYKQAITAAASGCQAAILTERYLEEKGL